MDKKRTSWLASASLTGPCIAVGGFLLLKYLDNRFRETSPAEVLLLSGIGLTLGFAILAWIDIGISKGRKRGLPRTGISILLLTLLMIVCPFFVRARTTTSFYTSQCIRAQEHLRYALWAYYRENNTTISPTYTELLEGHLPRIPTCIRGTRTLEIPDYDKDVSCPNGESSHYAPSCIHQQEKLRAALARYYADNRTTFSPLC